MSLVIAEGFEFYGNATADRDDLIYNRIGGSTNWYNLYTWYSLGGSQNDRYWVPSYQTNQSYPADFYMSMPARSEYFINFRFYLPNWSMCNTNRFFMCYANNSLSYPQFGFRINGNLLLDWGVGDYAAQTYFSARTIPPYAWHSITVRVKVHATQGVIDVYLNGSLLGSVTNVNTNTQGTGEISLIRFYNNWVNMIYDDLVIYNTDGAAPFNALLPTIHPRIAGFIPQIPVTDVLDSTVALLLRMEGSNASNSFVNSATTTSKALTIVGDTKIKTTVSKFGGSIYFDGTGDYLISNSSICAFGYNDFTVEMWLNINSPAVQSWPGILFTSNYNGGQGFYISCQGSGTGWGGTNALQFSCATDVTNGFNLASQTLVRGGGWKHVAITRQGVTTRMYINGVLEASQVSPSVIYFGATKCAIFVQYYNNDTTSTEKGYLDEMRVTNGVARYTGSTFTLQTAPYPTDLTDPYWPQVTLMLKGDGLQGSTTITDNSISANTMNRYGDTCINTSTFKFGTSAIYFDGTGDALRCNAPDFAFGTNDFTIEFWIYPINGSNGVAARIFETQAYGTAGGYQLIFISGQSKIEFGESANGTFVLDSASSLTNLAWTHVAISRVSGTTRLFINGTSEANTAYVSNYTKTALSIGSDNSGGNGFYGYLDEFRVTRGVGRYTSNFSVPTASFPLNVLSDSYWNNVVLMLCADGVDGSTIIVDSSVQSVDVVAVGSAKISTAAYKCGSSSAYFDGTSGYLTATNKSYYNFDTSDFTIEMWFLPRAYGANNSDGYYSNLIAKEDDSNKSYTLRFEGQSSFTALKFSYSTDGTNYLTLSASNPKIALFAWNHVAVTRSSGTLSLFLNSYCVATVSAAVLIYPSAGTALLLGASYLSSTVVGQFTGHMDEVRILYGRAAYTGALNSQYVLPGQLPLPLSKFTGLPSNVNKDTQSDGSYISAVDSNAISYFTPFATSTMTLIQWAAAFSGTVYAVQQYQRIHSNGVWCKFYSAIQSGGYTATTVFPIQYNSWTTLISTYLTAPDGGAWTWAKMSGLTFGVGRV